jgi:pyridoxamine 5'-phosphate oxidase-like protein
MAKVFDGIDDRLAEWIARQRLFFVGTAPREGGRVNVSPKGPIETLAVLGAREVAYLDLLGSGAETIAHLRDDGRICVMLCAFEGPPRIVRLHGRAEAHPAGTPEFARLAERSAIDTGAFGGDGAPRAFVRVEVERVADSCGFGVPLMSFEGVRPQQRAWVARKRSRGADALEDYRREHNTRSIDGLPALEVPPRA